MSRADKRLSKEAERRITDALDGVRPYLGSHGGDVHLLEVDGAALEGYGGPDSAPRRSGHTSPGETKGFNPQPDPPKTFSIGGTVISRRALTGSDGGYIPLVDLAKAIEQYPKWIELDRKSVV